MPPKRISSEEGAEDITGRDLLVRHTELGLTQSAMAKLLGIDRKTFHAWVHDKQPITHPRMVDLAMCELERRMAKSNPEEREQANRGTLPSRGGNMDRYEWRERQSFPLVINLIPKSNDTNEGVVRASIVQTGRERFVVNEEDRSRHVSASYTGFTSVESAKRFVERFEDLQCGESTSPRPEEDALSSSLSASS